MTNFKRTEVNMIKYGILLLSAGIMFAVLISPQFIKAETPHTNNHSIYLSELEWENATTKQGDAPNKDNSAEGNIITLTDNNDEAIKFKKGIGTHTDSEIVYDVSNVDYKYFSTWVGVDREVSNSNASLKFKIYVDDELVYESKVMKDQTPMEYTKVDITKAQNLKLVVINEGSGIDFVHGDWADTQLHHTNPVKNNITDIKEYEGMELVFDDEFDTGELDNEKWGFSTTPENGTHHYANKFGKDENIWVENGNLMIQAKEYDGNEDYSSTSAAVSTENKFDFRYGRVDVRAKIPTETGMWPAIWMMPANPDYGWPMEGEIDIMELISDQPNTIWSTIHSGIAEIPQYYFKAGDTATKSRGTYYDDYHVYSMKWKPDSISFYVDDKLVTKINDWKNWIIDSESGDIEERDYPAPFNQSFFLKLNLATGGWSQNVDETTRWGDRTTMKVDYVRVYQDDNQVSSVSDLKDLVGYYDKTGDFSSGQAVHELELHLMAVERFENTGDNEKVVKHLNGFKDLLDHQKEEKQISDEVYEILVIGADTLIDKSQ